MPMSTITHYPPRVGNWKMNPETLDSAIVLAKEIASASKTATAQVRLNMRPEAS